MVRVKLFFGVVLAVIVTVTVWALRPAYTPLITDDSGTVMPQSVAYLEPITIGGMDQWVLVRGHDKANPVLLWLHGGPGAAQIPIARHYNGELEKEFIVVHWDQRGAGKSNPRDFDVRTMNFDRFVSDVHELTQYLKQQFGKQRIFLVGHSWGSQLGIKVVQAHPEDYHAFVGVSQAVHAARGTEIARSWLLELFEKNGDTKRLSRLRGLGEPPYTDHSVYVEFAHMITAAGGGMDIGMIELARIALRSPEYRVADYIAWIQGSTRGSGPMWEETRDFDMFTEVPELKVPVYFFAGVNDYNTPFQLVEEYYRSVDAPEGKQLVRFEDSSHAPFMAEPDKFNAELFRVRREMLRLDN